MPMNELIRTLAQVANSYPDDLKVGQVRDIPRIAFNIGLALDTAKQRSPEELAICDLGGGIGLFSPGCAAYGFKRSVLIDDFNDPINWKVGDTVLSLHKSYGVEVISRDVIEVGISDLKEHFDIITTFDSMEHWHNSPRKLFGQVVEQLNPGGVFVLGVPNCVNLRKRISVPLGIGKWSSMEDWYEQDRFRAHVREPDVGDLRYIARDMGLRNVRILGRNWLGHQSAKAMIRTATKLLDHPLRLAPTLCADIYMVGERP